MIISRFIHITANGIISFSFMAKEYSIVYTYHIIFIHSSVDGHLGFFHVLANMNITTMNSRCTYLFELELFPNIFPGMGLLDHMVTLFLVL